MFKKWEGFFLAAAFLSFLFSNALYFGWIPGGTHEAGIFVGHWVTSILVAAIYLKVGFLSAEVKTSASRKSPGPLESKATRTTLTAHSKWYDEPSHDGADAIRFDR